MNEGIVIVSLGEPVGEPVGEHVGERIVVQLQVAVSVGVDRDVADPKPRLRLLGRREVRS